MNHTLFDMYSLMTAIYEYTHLNKHTLDILKQNDNSRLKQNKENQENQFKNVDLRKQIENMQPLYD